MARVTPPIVYATVPRAWDGETAVILGSGPSLTPEDVAYCRGRAKVVAVKDAIQLAPDADCLYACGLDASGWWRQHGDSVTVPWRLQFTLDPAAAKYAGVLKNLGESGLSSDPSGLKTGKNSGYQSIGLAVLLGATRIVLLGFDMGHGPHSPKYFYGNRPSQCASPFRQFLLLFETLIAPLKALGVTVLNASRKTELKSFPCCSLEEALA